MSVIRGETISETILLTPTGEILTSPEADASTLLEEECQKAFQKGVEKGQLQGYEQARREGRLFIDLLKTMSQKVLEQKGRLLQQLKPEIIEFALRVCERVIRRELTNPEAYVKMFNVLLSAAIPALQSDALTVHLAPGDLVILEKHLTKVLSEKMEIEGVKFVSDPMMRQGDCRIETKAGLLNYEISRELEDLQEKVLQR